MPKPVEIKGDKRLLNMLRTLPKSVDNKINRRAVNLGATPIVRAVKDECPELHGDLRRSIIKKVSSQSGRCDAVIGADANYVGEDGEKPSKYDHLVHDGHRTEDGSATAPNPYMQRGWDRSIATARDKYETELAKGIETEATKLGGG